MTVAVAPDTSDASELTHAEEVREFIFQDLSTIFNLTSYHFDKLTSTEPSSIINKCMIKDNVELSFLFCAILFRP